MTTTSNFRELTWLAALRYASPAKLHARYASEAAAHFAMMRALPDAVPVVIPAYREERDLPATLVSLLRSEHPVFPVVVDNNSGDRTPAIARSFGAVCLSAPTGRKMGATKVGIQYAVEQGYSEALFIDADTSVPRAWAGTMLGKLAMTGDEGGIVYGRSIGWHGPIVGDVINNCRGIASRVLRRLRGFDPKVPMAGHNYGLNLRGKVETAVLGLDSDLFFGGEASKADDIATLEAVRAAGGTAVAVPDSEACVLTRSRATAGQALSMLILRRSYEDALAPGYVQEYGTRLGDIAASE